MWHNSELNFEFFYVININTWIMRPGNVAPVHRPQMTV